MSHRARAQWICCLLLPALSWAASPFDGALSQAKTLMGQGQRKQALEQLTAALALAKTKKNQKEIAAKRKLFAEQFITTQSFQIYQEATALSEVGRWAECVQALDTIPPGDQDDTLTLKIRGNCQRGQGRFALALKAYQTAIEEIPGDFESAMSISGICYEQKDYPRGLALMQGLQPAKSEEVESFVVLKARFLAELDRANEAVELLRQDQERHLDHPRVLYELGSMYASSPKNDWLARKYLSLFLLRCKRMDDEELKQKNLDPLVKKAQTTLADVNSRLKV